MRALESEKKFSEFLLNIGDAKLNDHQNNRELKHFPPECIASSNCDIVQEIYSDIIAEKNFKEFVNRAILSPRNEDVNAINDKVVDLLDESTEKIYTSIDTVKNCDNGALSESLLPEYLNTLNPSSLPPHSLRLRLNSVVILLRNLSIEEGLCNGTRLLVLRMSDNVLCCEILTGDKAGQMAFIHRIALISERDFPFKFSRRQFPIKLAFAMTINKAQGQTFKKIGIDLTRDVFTHGQLYVALSGVRSWDSFKIFLNPENVLNSIKNYVFKQILI